MGSISETTVYRAFFLRFWTFFRHNTPKDLKPKKPQLTSLKKHRKDHAVRLHDLILSSRTAAVNPRSALEAVQSMDVVAFSFGSVFFRGIFRWIVDCVACHGRSCLAIFGVLFLCSLFPDLVFFSYSQLRCDRGERASALPLSLVMTCVSFCALGESGNSE